MTTTPLPLASDEPPTSVRIARAGGIAGALDLCLAMLIQFGVTGRIDLVRILQSIASGLLGRGSFDGGLGAASLGLALHFLIATIWAALYFVAATRLGWLSRLTASAAGRIASGLAFGLVVWSGMNLVVVPLSRAPGRFSLTWATAAMVVGHMVMVGLPIALAVGAVRLRRDRSARTS
jgi:hypothetical protein